MSAHARSVLALLLVAPVVAAAAPAAAAPATSVTCDQVVTEDVVLDGDLHCGFSIGADGITVDLAGHTITDGSIAVGFSGVTITGGTMVRGGVSAFQIGSNPPLTGLTVREMTFRDAPFAAFNSSGNLSDSVIVDSRFIGNRRGIHGTSNLGGLLVTGSEFRGNGAAVALVFNAHNYVFTDNDFVDNASAIALTESDRHVVEGNRFVGNTCGFCGFISGANQIRGNEFRSNDLGVGFSQVFSTGNVVDGNRFFDNGVGVRFGSPGSAPSSQFAGAVVSGNLFNDNRTAGLQYFGSLPSSTPRPDSVVTGNRAIRNGRSPDGSSPAAGLYVFVGPNQPPVVVAHNVANVNAGYGIEGHGVTDGGRNHAANNGNPAQCLGVLC